MAVLDDWQNVARDSADWSALQARAEVQFFHQAFGDQQALSAALQPFDIILPMRERSQFPAAVLEALPRLRFIALTGRPTRHIDMAVCQRRGILCSWSGTYHPEMTAEYTLGLIIAAQRNIVTGAAALRAGGFQQGVGLGQTLRGATLGLIGLGNIGGLVAQYGAALGMEVLAWSRSLTPARAQLQHATAVTLEELLTRANIVSVHLPLTAETRGLLGTRELGLMRPHALLVNTSRGPIVDESSLLVALQAGRIRAALDVFDVEPLPGDHPLRSAPNVLLSPHLGFATQECFTAFYQDCIENIHAFLDGRPIRLVNPEALGAAP
ncbi:MAG: D-2-hydroxyacid dehydrogenase family protein [Paludibacter sp.]